MNAPALIKTAAVVLLVGSATIAGRLQASYAESPDRKASREIAKCIKERSQADRARRLLQYGNVAQREDQKIRTACTELSNKGLQVGED